MDKTPKLYTVMAWWRNPESGKFKLNMHHVAGFDSEDASRRMLAENGHYLSGQLFINTDEYLDYRGDRSTSMYVTSWRDEGEVDQRRMREWIDRSLHASEQDGEYFPATYRRFHKQPV